jgi:hypothetical protein
VHTDATRESIRVSIDFFRFIAESMLFTCNFIQSSTLNGQNSKQRDWDSLQLGDAGNMCCQSEPLKVCLHWLILTYLLT